MMAILSFLFQHIHNNFRLRQVQFSSLTIIQMKMKIPPTLMRPTPQLHIHPPSDASTDTDSDDDDDADNHAAISSNNTGRPRRSTAGATTKYDAYHMFTTAAEDELVLPKDTMATVCHYLMVHYSQPAQPKSTSSKRKLPPTGKKANVFSLNAGLKRFGERGETAVAKELNQLNMLHTFVPLDAKSLTYEQRRSALASLIFLTEK